MICSKHKYYPDSIAPRELRKPRKAKLKTTLRSTFKFPRKMLDELYSARLCMIKCLMHLIKDAEGTTCVVVYEAAVSKWEEFDFHPNPSKLIGST